MEVLVVIGSNRKNSQSARIGRVLVEQYLPEIFERISVHNLAELDLPFWDEGVDDNTIEWAERLHPLHSAMARTDAFVFLTPEWSGMVTPMLKNYFLLGDAKAMRHKPALIVSVSAGSGGAYPVMELRGSSYKNTKICFIPEHIIVRDVENVFVENHSSNSNRIGKRIKFACQVLAEYSRALKSVREANLEWDKYLYGM